jgi:nucleoside-diphosphate-sugar epimerase
VLRAARDAGVERVVLTSAFHAVGFGHPHSDHVFTEEDWSVLDGPGMDAYGRSKVLAERAAWDFVETEGGQTGLTTILPVDDVRDVARAHVLAMTTPQAAGQRILISGGPAIPMKRIGAILKEHLGVAAKRVPTRGIPDFVVRLAARFNAEFRPIAPDLGHARKVSGDKARDLLGLTPRDPEQAIVAAAESMIHKSLVTS